MGGTFVLRIEDTDRARSTDESLQIILEGLRWLGIDWDEGPDCGGDYGPYFQMQRLERYRQASEQLLAGGHAYSCYCTPERIDAVREQQKAAKSSFLGYDGHCRDLSAEQRAEFESQGIVPNLRFRMPRDRVMKVHDLIRGESDIELRQLDDWVMVRPDGVPLYNFACVVDDIDMKITHVVRGEEHKMNGVKQLLLFEALGQEAPQYAHIPLILNMQGGKLSKRDPGVMSVLEYRDQGYPPAAIFNAIALLGWGFSADRDIFTRDEMIEVFRIESVGKSGAKFDEQKMRAICGDYIRRMSPRECLEAASPWLGDAASAALAEQPHYVENVVACYQERVQLYSEFADKIGWCFAELSGYDAGAEKGLRKHADARMWLTAYAEALTSLDLPPSYPEDRRAADEAVRLPSQKDAPEPDVACASPAAIEAHCRAFAEQHGVKFGHLVQPVRAALTGSDKGPGLFDVVFLLGATRAAQRLHRAADWLGQQAG